MIIIYVNYQILNIYNFLFYKMDDTNSADYSINSRNEKIKDFFINSLSVTMGLLFFVLLVFIYIKYGLPKTSNSNLKKDNNDIDENLEDISDLFDDV